MEIFFNELSVRVASSDTEAEQWLVQLAELVRLLKEIVDTLSEEGFAFRRSEYFAEQPITSSQNIREFLSNYFEFSDPIVIFLYGIFDSPYITENDPYRSEFELSTLIFQDEEFKESGLIAAYLKNSLAISLLTGPQWDSCEVDIKIKRLNKEDEEKIVEVQIHHTSTKQHLFNCHWGLIASIFDWKNYKPRFEYKAQNQNVLHFMPLYSLIQEEKSWDSFYRSLVLMSTEERVKEIRTIATDIAMLHKWELATGTIANSNGNRIIYMIPNSSLIAALDTQHGEFEIHRNTKGNNHLGAISFDGKMKAPRADRKLNL